MNCKNIKYYGLIILLIASAQLFLGCSKGSKNQQDNNTAARDNPVYEKIKLSSKEFMQYCDLVITADSAGIYVQRGDSILLKHFVPGGCFPKFITYDRLTGYISYSECSATERSKDQWNFDLKVWDYKHDKERHIKKGDYYVFDSMSAPKVINYNENNNTALIINYSWLKALPAYYDNGQEKDFKEEDNWVNIEAVLPDNEFLIYLSRVDDEDGEGPGSEDRYAKYSLKNDEYTIITKKEFLNYNDLMLKQFGNNYSVKIDDKYEMSDLNWNPKGSVFVAKHYVKGKPGVYEFYFCNKDASKIYVLQTDKTTVIPIWK